MLELLYIARLDYLARDSARRETETARSIAPARGDDFHAQLERAAAARRKARRSHALVNGRAPFGTN